jgi:hypothetical protein
MTPMALLILICPNDQLCFLSAFYHNTVTSPISSGTFTEIFGVLDQRREESVFSAVPKFAETLQVQIPV